MTDDELTHERCSELLADFAAGHLDASETARIEAHLAGCSECDAELRAIMALRAGDEPLNDVERARLRRGIAASIGDVIAPARETSRSRARLATALGAAALLAIVGVAGVSLLTGQRDDDSTAATSGPVRNQVRDAGADSAGGGGVAAGEAAKAPRPRPTYDRDAGHLSGKKLTKIGERSAALTAFQNAYSVEDATELRDEYVSDLARQAESPVDNLILSCAEQVYEAQPYAALPAFAAQGELEGEEALVLGFAWTDQQSGPLNRFMLWTWPESSCERPIDYRAGEIAPQK